MSNRMSRLAALLAGILLASAAGAADAVRVGSKIDTEGALLGNIIQQVLEAHGVKTEGRLSLGNTKVMRTAIAAGEIDIYPEYTGNGAFFFSDEKNPAWKSAAAGYQRVKQLDYDKNRIVWLAPAAASAEFIERPDALPAFQNAYGFKLRQDQLLALAGGDTSATIKAAAEQTSGVNAAMAYGTEPTTPGPSPCAATWLPPIACNRWPTWVPG
ncbi:glycine betaine ABC transporter substrate-binding protein [Chromobacterium piscinae]|uniref:glycine betaine ABC transporter substrate-binding protein n=1 Tax=Chromobacterium piscinae TaxID=686831 RepID=UPI0031FDDEB7